MVDPVSDEDRRRTMLYAKIVLALLIGGSAGLITSQGDASLEIVLGAVLVGLLIGAVLAWYLLPAADEVSPAANREYRR